MSLMPAISDTSKFQKIQLPTPSSWETSKFATLFERDYLLENGLHGSEDAYRVRQSIWECMLGQIPGGEWTDVVSQSTKTERRRMSENGQIVEVPRAYLVLLDTTLCRFRIRWRKPIGPVERGRRMNRWMMRQCSDKRTESKGEDREKRRGQREVTERRCNKWREQHWRQNEGRQSGFEGFDERGTAKTPNDTWRPKRKQGCQLRVCCQWKWVNERWSHEQRKRNMSNITDANWSSTRPREEKPEHSNAAKSTNNHTLSTHWVESLWRRQQWGVWSQAVLIRGEETEPMKCRFFPNPASTWLAMR